MTASRRTLFSGAALVEVALLLGGILLAFGLEAWWADRAERLELRAELGNVLAEFEVNRELVDQYLGWHHRADTAATTLVRVLESSGPGSVVVPDSLIWGTGFTPTFDPRTGALTALLTSGRFGSIADAELRSALAGFNGYLRDARDEEIRARDYTDLQVVNALVRSGDVERALGCEECRDSGFPSRLETHLQNSPELRTHLARRALFASLSIESLTGVRDQVDRISQLIRSELQP